MNKKKILFVMPLVRPGGVGSALASLYNSIDKNKYEIDVLSMSNVDDNAKSVLPYSHVVLQANKMLRAYFSALSEVKGLYKINCVVVKIICKILIKCGIDVEGFLYHVASRSVECRKKYDTIVGFIEGPTTKFASFFNCADKIAWVHVDYNQYLPVNKSEELLYAQFRSIVTVANYTTTIFKQRYPALAYRVVTIHNPLDINRVLALAKEPINDNRFIKDDFFSIISVGRIAEIKRFSLIPEIASHLKHLKFRWYIIGPVRNQIEYNLLCQNIIKYKVEDTVILLGSKLNPYPYFYAADLLVSTSRSEACPMIFNEAQILNLPIVTADYPSAFEFITNEHNGLICPISSIDKAIEQLIVNKDLYGRIKKNSTFSTINNEKIVEDFYKIIEQK